MICPRCGSTLTEINYEGVLIETCDNCGGEWLDHEEIAHVIHVEEKEFSEEEVVKVKGVNDAVVTEMQQPEKPLLCPHCKIPLHVLNYNYSTGVIVDKCHQCHGIWLDKDELEHIQIIMEERKKRFPEMQAKFIPVIAKIKEDAHHRRKEHTKMVVESSRKHLKHPIADAVVHAMLWHLFD